MTSTWAARAVERHLQELRTEWRMWQDPAARAVYRARRLAEIEDEGRYFTGDRSPDRCARLANRLRMPIGGVRPDGWPPEECGDGDPE